MPRLDLTLVLFWASLGFSAAAVLVFLWLMRQSRESPARSAPAGNAKGPAAEIGHPEPPEAAKDLGAAQEPRDSSALRASE